jgi:hypothetical protein
MIGLKITPTSSNALYAEIDAKIDGIKELLSPATKKQLVDVAFSKAAIDFVKRTNMSARSNKSMFHHVYEWGGTGSESARLFRLLKRNSAPGSASVYYKFNNSRKKSPIDDVLKIPGRTGKVVTKSGVFKNKAAVMEKGSPISFTTSRTIAIPAGNSISFIPPGKNITIKNPGGRSTTGTFEKHFRLWWTTNFPLTLEKANIPLKLEKSLASALTVKGAGRASAKSAISRTLARYKVIGSVV